jgi:hypothetical protein
MDPQAVTVGARAGRRILPIIGLAMKGSPDPVAFCAGMVATIAGGIGGLIGTQTAAEILRIALGQLEQKPQLELPPGVRLALATAANETQPADPEAPHA